MPRKSEVLDELTGLIGYSQTMELLRAWGGRRLRVPKEVGEDHPITFTVGLNAARSIAQYYGGTELDLPAERNALMEVRNAAMMRDLAKGESTKACAIRYGMTPRHVRYIRNCYDRRGRGIAKAEM